MKKISLTILVFLFLAFFSGASDIQDDCDRLSRAQMQSMIEFLSADALEGRAPGTRGATVEAASSTTQANTILGNTP